MGLQLSHESAEFISRYQPVCHQRLTMQVGKGNQESAIVTNAVDVGRTDSPESRIAESSAAQQSRQPPAHVNVEASPGAKVTQGVPEPVPRAVGRLADPRDPVEFLKGDNAPGTHQRCQFGYHPLRVRHVDKQEPGVGKVERCSLQPSVGGPRLHQCDLGPGMATQTPW